MAQRSYIDLTEIPPITPTDDIQDLISQLNTLIVQINFRLREISDELGKLQP